MPNDRTQDVPRVMSRRAKLLAAGLVAAAAVAVAACFMKRGPTADPGATNDGNAKERLFRDWPKPDLVVVVSGEEHGYMQPCGCSDPQFGGLARRYNFVESLKARGWPVVRSVTRLASTTVPNAANASCRSFSVTLKSRFPTNNLVLMDVLNCPGQFCARHNVPVGRVSNLH